MVDENAEPGSGNTNEGRGFSGRRATRTATLDIDFPPSRVFPLLCPERERDWVINWDYTPVYPATGYAERDCIFMTDLPQEGPSIWAFTAYEPSRHLEIVRVTPGLALLHWSMKLEEPVPGKTALLMTWTVTGLSAKGNRYIEESLDARFSVLMRVLGQSMNHYLRTGEKLPAVR